VENLEDLGLYNEVYVPVHSDNLVDKYRGRESEKTEYIYSKCFNKIDRVNFKLKNKKIYSDLLKKVDLDKVDVVHAHSLFVNGYLAYKLKMEKNIDYVVAVRNTDVNTFFKKMIHLRKIGVDILKNAKKIIFISPRYQEFVIDTYIPADLKEDIRKKSTVLPNGIDEFWFENLYLEPRAMKKDDIKLIYVGKLDKNKNTSTIIKAVDILRDKGYGASLDVVGDGPEHSNLKKQAESSKSRDRIKFYGYMEKEDIINLYRKEDIFVMPSKYETFGLVYIEAITQGLPVVYTKNQGFDGYFDEGVVGYGVNYKDTEEISKTIIEMVDRKTWEFKDIEEGLKESFDWKKIATRYMDIYSAN
jgi:glycosyltransferase involved in cell wall biosynthesis